MRINRQPWLYPAENCACLFRRGVMIDNPLLLFRSVRVIAGAVGVRIEYFVNQ